MGTVIRAELSKKNPYWIERHRYYELKHFCLQYPAWKKAYNSLLGLSSRRDVDNVSRNKYQTSNPTEHSSMIRAMYAERMRLVEDAAEESDSDIFNYLILAVTKGVSYENLKTMYDIPCCREKYYESYRKFFWILNQKRG